MRKELIELKKAWYKLAAYYVNAAEAFDMNPFEFKVYHIIFLLKDDCTQKKLLEYTSGVKQAVNNVVKKFEKDGLVSLTMNNADKRSKKVKLTKKGLELWDAKFDKLIKVEEESLNAFSNEEILGFINFINKYEKMLDSKLEEFEDEK